MPPRLDLFSSFRAQSSWLSQRTTATSRTTANNGGGTYQFSTTSSTQASKLKQKREYQHPYVLAQIKARRAANISRQEVLQAERSKAFGDPVRGVTTPFVESFDTGKPVPPEVMRQSTVDTELANAEAITTHTTDYLNHFLTQQELERSIEASDKLASPIRLGPREISDPAREQEAILKHEQQHVTAAEALRRIAAVENASSKDRTRINIQRCVEMFGRHNTDDFLRPKPASNVPRGPDAAPLLENTPRAGPDTGSSEVQIAILTAKIRALSENLDVHGRKDKMNKRNLRLLIHRRQKLLSYLRRREKGGERWQFLIQTLGLTEATWRGEITL